MLDGPNVLMDSSKGFCSLLEELANSLLEELANSLNGLFGLLMAFKVNFDPTIGFLMSNMSSMPSFRSFGGLIWPSFEL